MTDKKVSSILREIGGDNQDLTQDEINDLRYILAHILDTEKARLILYTDRELTDSQFQQWQEARSKLIQQKIPVHYIINTKNFMGLDFFVDERVLIPRFDTEILVEQAMLEINKLREPRILELCTGSGAIPISLIHNIKNDSADKPMPGIQITPLEITALDISEDALDVADINKKKLLSPAEQKQLKFIHSDLFENVPRRNSQPESQSSPDVDFSSGTGYHLIIANPPYVTHQEYEALDEKVKKEPFGALVAEDEGLFFYEKILSQARDYLHPDHGVILFEIGSLQGSALQAMAAANGYQECTIIPDYAGHSRVAIIR
jgi:release factor glutamine methyltransferase